jgi:hypothetical protein
LLVALLERDLPFGMLLFQPNRNSTTRSTPAWRRAGSCSTRRREL